MVWSAAASCSGLWVETPSQQLRTDDLPGAFRRKIVLPHVHSVEIRRQAQIRAVVHDQFDARSEQTFQFARLFEHLPGIARLVAVLQESNAAGRPVPRQKTYKSFEVGEEPMRRGWRKGGEAA